MTGVPRRRVLRVAGVFSLSATSGCLGGDDEPAFDGADGDIDEWLADVGTFDAIHDRTDSDRVYVSVGGDNGFAFDPAAVRIAPGTTVVWEWTGDGGYHDVVHVDREFESDRVDEAGYTFEHSFESSGTYNYVCEPHVGMEMKGSVVVE